VGEAPGSSDAQGVRDDRIERRDGMAFNVRSHGVGVGPPLVFLHGVLASAISYDDLCQSLALDRQVVAIDQRGHGLTDHASDYEWERWVEDIASIVSILELGPIDLVGHSMGAKHAARFAALHPNKVRRLALLDAGFGEPNSPDQAEYWGRVARLFPPDGFGSLDEYVEMAIEQFPRASRRILERSTAGFVCGNDGRWRWPLQADVDGLAKSRTEPTAEEEARLRTLVTCPTLVARAEFSELFTGDGYVQVAQEYAAGSHQLLHGTGHMIMWESVDNTVATLEAFLATN
jgi:pimeloyl-ACP methyl ester carboxylesterase